jgi:hypothetical protein
MFKATNILLPLLTHIIGIISMNIGFVALRSEASWNQVDRELSDSSHFDLVSIPSILLSYNMTYRFTLDIVSTLQLASQLVCASPSNRIVSSAMNC